jgi:hypothetical protein
MASILDNLRDNRGIRILDTQLNSTSAMAGAYDILYHTNGYIYVAFARNNLAYPAVGDRQIWMARSTDGGTNFETPVKISEDNDKWHDNPAILQIDPADTGSPIGLVFTQAVDWQDRLTAANERGYPYRVLVDVDLTLLSSIDILTNATYNNSGLTVVRGLNSFQVYCLVAGSADYIRLYENVINLGNTADGFLNNAWTTRTISNFAGTGQTIKSIKVRPLSSGHLALVGAIQRSVVGLQPLCDLGATFSSDDGLNWSAFQYLTNYTGTPAVDLVGIDQCVDVDVTEVAANQLAIVYQEGTPSQELKSTSSPSLTLSNVFGVVHHSSKNVLFIADINGIYVFDLATSTTIFHFTTSSTPPLWYEKVYAGVTLSPDGKYLATGSIIDDTNPGALDVWDISDATPANWTVVASLRTTTTPAIKGTSITWCKFISNTEIAYTHAGGTSAGVIGGILDVTDLGSGITDILAPNNIVSTTFYAQPHVDTDNDAIYICASNYLWRSKISDGTVQYSYNYGSTMAWLSVYHDPINDELVLPYSTRLFRFTDTGAAFTLLETISGTTDPRVPETIENQSTFEPIGTGGLLLSTNQKGSIWYDFHSRKITGAQTDAPNIDVLGYDPFIEYTQRATTIKNTEWLAYAHNTGLHMQRISQTGKLRWGIFTYTPATKVIDDTSDDFHLLCDTAWVSANDALHLVKPKISTAPLENVVLTAIRYYPQSSGIQLITGVMNRERLTIGMKATIAKVITKTFTSRARIRLNPTRTVSMKAGMVFAQCLKVMAYIMPKQVQTFQMKASMLNFKSTSFTGLFSVSYPGKQRALRLQFTANTGYTGLQTTTSKARIVKVGKKRFTSHFLVMGNPNTTGAITFEAADLYFVHKLGMKAFVVSNR